jgi:hypothetical protein
MSIAPMTRGSLRAFQQRSAIPEARSPTSLSKQFEDRSILAAPRCATLEARVASPPGEVAGWAGTQVAPADEGLMSFRYHPQRPMGTCGEKIAGVNVPRSTWV